MKVTAEPLPERQVRLQIEIEPERHAQAIEQAYKRLAPRVQIRGFRPGKAPRPLIERQLGRHRLLDEAMDILIPEAYKEAVEEQSITPVAQPSVELVSHEPLVFTATVPLEPTIDLGDYQALRLPRSEISVSEEQVEESITDLRRRYGTIEPVERPAQKGDVIRGDVKAEVDDGNVLFQQDDIEFRLTDEALSSLPGLGDVIVGLTKGDELQQSVEAPADFSDARIAGKSVTYTVRVDEVKEEKLAEADDAFAKEVGEGFDSLSALRDRIRSDLKESAEEAALREYEATALDALVEQSTLEYPSVLVEHQIDHMLEDEANLDPRDPRAQQLYLARLGKTEQEVRDSVRTEAEQRLRRSLVLGRFAEAENITVEDSDVDAEIERMASSAGEQADAIRQIFGTEANRETIKSSLRTRKTLGRLVEIAGGAAAETDTGGKAAGQAEVSASEEGEPEAEGQAEKAPKRRRTSPRTAD